MIIGLYITLHSPFESLGESIGDVIIILGAIITLMSCFTLLLECYRLLFIW